MTSTGSMSFTYDANGNTTDRNGTDITWASYNLPSRIERPSGEYSEFLYGGDRSRYQQIEGSGALQSVRHYASPGLFEVLRWNSGASRVDYHYIHANGRAVAQFTTSNVEADELQYLHRDHQGSVVATTASNGTLLDRFEYDPFGARTTTVGSSDRMHRGYTGHEHLEALDLIHMNGRVQDPVLGRFLSPDPFVWEPYRSQSLNRYSYVWNNPLSLVDPSGFQECKLGNMDPDCVQQLKCIQDPTSCITVYPDPSALREQQEREREEARHRQLIEDTRQALDDQNHRDGHDPSADGGNAYDTQRQGDGEGISAVPIVSAVQVPDPPSNLPGGPYEKAPGQRPGDFYGPKRPSGPRDMLRYVPPHGEGGPPGSKGYWKIQTPEGWQRYDTRGKPISVDQAHRMPRGSGAPPSAVVWATRIGWVATFILWEFPLE